MNIKQQVESELKKVISDLGISDIDPKVDYPADPKHGDYSTNIALLAGKKLGRSPLELAQQIVTEFKVQSSKFKVAIAPPGFINFWISNDILINSLKGLDSSKKLETSLTGKKLLIEFAHPNTHKEIHIGHMRTLITGEALARLAEAAGAKVFRANYQGDIGPHVAKAIYGIQKLMEEKGLALSEVATWKDRDKAHFLGEGYAWGSRDYTERKEEIDLINKQIYQKDSRVNEIYQKTRQWSLDYYKDFYKRFYTEFDRLFFESDMADAGKKIVQANIGKIFKEENGAVIFKGEDYGLHTRVFITAAGNPTYEGKEMQNALMEYEAFPFDKKIHVVGSEQAGYFKVVFKALELLNPEKFTGKQYHISMGMVQLTDRKMSSRTGDVLTVDWLIDKVKEKVEDLMTDEKLDSSKKDQVIEDIAIAAIKYSVLQVGTTQNVIFDIKKSVTLQGNSGPYIQYAYVRTQSVLRKTEVSDLRFKIKDLRLEPEEREVLRLLNKFDEVVEEAAVRFAPNILCTYLFELAQAFNLFYQKCPILHAEGDSKSFRLDLTSATGSIIKKGLNLLGILAPDKM